MPPIPNCRHLNLNLGLILIFSLSDGYISGCSDVADERFKFPREKLVLGQSSSEPDEEERRSVERGGKQKKGSKFMPKLKQAKGGRRVLARPSKLCQAKLQCFEKLEIFGSV